MNDTIDNADQRLRDPAVDLAENLLYGDPETAAAKLHHGLFAAISPRAAQRIDLHRKPPWHCPAAFDAATIAMRVALRKSEPAAPRVIARPDARAGLLRGRAGLPLLCHTEPADRIRFPVRSAPNRGRKFPTVFVR
jgi:hypothetical protein